MILYGRDINYWYAKFTMFHIYYSLVFLNFYSFPFWIAHISQAYLQDSQLECVSAALKVTFISITTRIFYFVTWFHQVTLISSCCRLIDFLSFCVSSLDSCLRGAISHPQLHMPPPAIGNSVHNFHLLCCFWKWLSLTLFPWSSTQCWTRLPNSQRPTCHRFSGDDNVGFIPLQLTKIGSCKAACRRFLLHSKLLEKNSMTAQSVIQPHLLPLREPNVHTNFVIPHMQLIGFVPMVVSHLAEGCALTLPEFMLSCHPSALVQFSLHLPALIHKFWLQDFVSYQRMSCFSVSHAHYF